MTRPGNGDVVVRPQPELTRITAPIATTLRSIPDRKARGRRRVAEVVTALRTAPQSWERNGWRYTLDAEPWVKIAEKDVERAAACFDLTVHDGVRTIFRDRVQAWDGTPVLTADGTQREEVIDGETVLRDNFREDPVEAARSDLEHTVRVVTKDGETPHVKANPGTVSTFFGITGDGRCVSSDATYATARTGGTLAANTTLITVGQSTGYNDYEGFCGFDTSALPDTDVISQADLSLWLIVDGSVTDLTVQARPKTWTPSGLTTADWVSGADLGALTLLATLTSNGIGATGEYKTFTENGTNLQSAISLTGNSEFILNSDRHEAGTTPTTNEQLSFEDADNAGTTNDPKLVVTHAALNLLGAGALSFTGNPLVFGLAQPLGDGALAFDGKGLTLVPATPLPLGDGALAFTGKSGTGILRDAFLSAPSLRVDFYSSAGAKLDLQPLQGTDILQASYTLGVNRIGSFMLTVAADCEAAAGATGAREVWVYRNNEGLVFKGVIMSQAITASADGKLVMRIAGLSTGVKLLWKTTLLGKTFAQQTLSTVVTALLTDSGFSSGSIASPSTNYEGRFDVANIWEALMRVAETFGLLLREDNLTTTIDIGAFGDVSGVIFSNVPEITPELAENENYLPIKSIRIASESKEVWNKIIPLGHQQGIAGSDSWLTLADSDRSSPYTIQSATPSGQPTYYYIGDSTSQTAYGTRERAVTFNHILPLGASATDKLRAANALYDAAVNYLQLYKDEQVVYDVQVTNLKHLDGSAYRFQAGDKIHVEYEGMVTDEDGARTWKSVDADLFLMDFTRTFNEDGSDDWRFTLSTVDRVLQTPEMIQARAYSGIQSVQTAPMPELEFGDGIGRLDKVGLQFATGGFNITGVYFVDELLGAITSANDRAYFEAGVGPSDVSLALAAARANNTETASVLVTANSSGGSVTLRALDEDAATPLAYVILSKLGATGAYGRLQFSNTMLHLPSFSADPTGADLTNGAIWYNTTSTQLKAYVNGSVVVLA